MSMNTATASAATATAATTTVTATSTSNAGRVTEDKKVTVTQLDYEDLMRYSDDNDDVISKKCRDAIEQAFAQPDSLGLLCITHVNTATSTTPNSNDNNNIHTNYEDLRIRLLKLARMLGDAAVNNDSNNSIQSLVAENAGFQVGWSHGVEKLAEGQCDFSKGSYYANPLVDDYVNMLGVKEELIRDEKCRLAAGILSGDCDSIQWQKLNRWIEQNPAFFAPNVWPNVLENMSDLKGLSELESAFKDMGLFLHQVAIRVAKVMDGYVKQVDNSFDSHLSKVLTGSRYCKGRLLHYFGQDNQSIEDNEVTSPGNGFGDWCGWHNDHGSLTALVPAIYLDSNGNIVNSPDPRAGLYVMSRKGVLKHIEMPENSIGIQVGETTQIHTGGILQATPHCVRGCHSTKDSGFSKTTRETFAIFFEPEYHHNMEVHLKSGPRLEEADTQEARKFLPPNVRPINTRWQRGMNFGEFSLATFQAFH